MPGSSTGDEMKKKNLKTGIIWDLSRLHSTLAGLPYANGLVGEAKQTYHTSNAF